MTVELIDNKFKRRDKLFIMTEIMGICKNGSSKTNIMFKANLSFAQLNHYLCFLSDSGLLEKVSTGGRNVYRSTDKGLEIMRLQKHIIDLLNEKKYKRSSINSPSGYASFSRNKINLMY